MSKEKKVHDEIIRMDFRAIICVYNLDLNYYKFICWTCKVLEE
jgi:hypothetical protein